MSEQVAQDFEVLDVAEVRRLTTTIRSKPIDMDWANRISTLAIGRGFKTTRPPAENVRQFKKRMNSAAAYTGRTLEWTTLDPKTQEQLSEGIEPSQFLAKVKAIDPNVEKAAKEAAQAAQSNGTVNQAEGQPGETNPSESTENEPQSGSRRR